MTTRRMHWGRRCLVAVALGGLGGLTACGSGGPSEVGTAHPEVPAPPNGASAAAYGDLLGALDRVKVPTCQPSEGGGAGFIALPPPAAEAARAYSWFRYREGRIYEFGPCQLASGHRNELRIYRYDDTAARDQALRDVSRRGTRPTSTFAYLDVHAVEIWSPEPSLESPVGQLAAQVHTAIGALPQAWHLDLEVGG